VGCREALCVEEARDGSSDSGVPVANVLGVTPILVDRAGWRSRPGAEIPFIAGDGQGEDCWYSGAESHLAGRVLLTGVPGDHWRKHAPDTSPYLVRMDATGLSLTEYRLSAGFVHCPVPYFGLRQAADISAISHSTALAPWDRAAWSKPICRRIAEEAGIPGELFGQAKKATAVLLRVGEGAGPADWDGGNGAGFKRMFATHPRDGLTAGAYERYAAWLARNRRAWLRAGRLPPSAAADRLVARAARAEERVVDAAIGLMSRTPVLWRHNNSRRLYLARRLSDWWTPRFLRRYLFAWSVSECVAKYPVDGVSG
jgi:hypothetical protein